MANAPLIWFGSLAKFLKPFTVTNAAVAGTPGSPSTIITGDPNTKGLIVKGTTQTGGGAYTPQTNATLFASYGTSFNANYANGSTTGTPNGVATIVGSKLQLFGSGYVDYSAISNASFTQTGTIRFNHTPDYSGAPGSTQALVFIGESSGYNNCIEMDHYTDGSILVYIYNSAGSTVVSIQDAGVYVPIAGTTYEIELCFDLTTGATRIFLNGSQVGSTHTGTGTRVNTFLSKVEVGNNLDFGSASNDYSMDNLILYSTVQHTTNFTGEIPRTYPQGGTVLQTSNLQEWQSSGSVMLANVDPSGNIQTAGLEVTSGADKRIGTSALTTGSVTVNNASITASTVVILTGIGTTNAGALSLSTVVPGVSFLVQSTNVLDSRSFSYLLVEPV